MRIAGILLLCCIALLIAGWVIFDGTSEGAIQRAGDEQWPARLGKLESVEARYPKQERSEAAKKLVELAAPLGISFALRSGRTQDALRKAVGEYVAAEHVRDVAAINAPPAEVSAYLAEHAAQIDALRDHLVQGGPIAWELDLAKGSAAPVPNLLAHMHISRLLTARALMRAREHDVRAWDDLHAAWNLTHSLEARPELISQLIALAMTRMVNAAAWKLPASDAEWLAELQQVDHRSLLLRAFQYDTWGMWRHIEQETNHPWIAKPYVRWSAAQFARHQRKTAEEVARVTTCAFDSVAFARRRSDAIPDWNVMSKIATPNLDTTWARAFRSVAEREAVANAMRVMRGEQVVATSQCSDGAWTYEGGRVKFSRELPASSPAEKLLPLSLVVAP